MPVIPGSGDCCCSLDTLDFIDVACELRGDAWLHLSGDAAHDFLDEDVASLLAKGDAVQFHVTAYTTAQSCPFTMDVPLAWVNRVVSVKLEFGQVIGVLTGDTLDDCTHIQLEAFPHRPCIAPLPKNQIRGVALVDQAIHLSYVHSNDDEQGSVWRWRHQEMGNVQRHELQLDSVAMEKQKQAAIQWGDLMWLDNVGPDTWYAADRPHEHTMRGTVEKRLPSEITMCVPSVLEQPRRGQCLDWNVPNMLRGAWATFAHYLDRGLEK